MFIIDHIISKINQVGVVISQEVLIRVFHPAEWFYFPLPSTSNSGSRIPYNMEQEKTNRKKCRSWERQHYTAKGTTSQ